ncbi:MAG: hypothetical protein Q9214_004598, partial [Letrouitia sp. 1 TL-2023]
KREQKNMGSKVLEGELDESVIFQEHDEQDMEELQRQGQEELADLEFPFPSELEFGRLDADQSAPKIPAQNCSNEAIQKSDTQTDVSVSKSGNSPAQGSGRQRDRSQVKGQDERLMKQVHEPEARAGQGHGKQEQGHELQTQENRQDGRGHWHEANEEGDHKDETYEDVAHNDKVEGYRQVDEAQEVVQEDEAYKEGQVIGPHGDNVQDYRARERRESDGEALRSQQVRAGRKPVERGKYQRLNRLGSMYYDMNPEDDTPMDGTGE